MKNITLAIAAASMGAASVATPALASNTVTKTIKVSVDGLDLNTISGQETLEKRVEFAAKRVCGYSDIRTDARLRRDAQKCMAKARAGAAKQMAAIIEDQRRGGCSALTPPRRGYPLHQFR